MEGPDIPKTFSFGFLAMSLPPLQSTGHLTHRRAARGAGEFLSEAVLRCFHQTQGKQTVGSEGPELAPCRPADGQKGAKTSATTKGNAVPYC